MQQHLKTPSQTEISDDRRELQQNDYQSVTLLTDRGKIQGRYYAAERARFGAIWVGGVGGGWDTPANGLYPQLCQTLRSSGISSLRLRYRYSTCLEEAVFDTLAGIMFLAQENIPAIALIGHSFGGAVVIQAAALSPIVQTVITLASQGYGTAPAAQLAPRCSLLLLHGTADPVLSPRCSQHIYAIAQEPKRLILCPEAKHGLDEVADRVSQVVHDWLIDQL